MSGATPYAVFRHDGLVIEVTSKRHFEALVADGERCQCGECLSCRAAEYKRESEADE